MLCPKFLSPSTFCLMEDIFLGIWYIVSMYEVRHFCKQKLHQPLRVVCQQCWCSTNLLAAFRLCQKWIYVISLMFAYFSLNCASYACCFVEHHNLYDICYCRNECNLSKIQCTDCKAALIKSSVLLYFPGFKL